MTMTSVARALVGAASLLTVGALPGVSLACACGCGVFEVGDITLMPGGSGGTVWLDNDYLDQSQNWSGASRASPGDNTDKRIISDFVTLGAQYMGKSGLGLMVEVPITDRSFTTNESGAFESHRHTGLGDIRVTGVYAGFSADHSTGITFGLKLPTGGFGYSGYDRDVQIGSGTTDFTLGGYHVGAIGRDTPWSWFAQVKWDHPFGQRSGYRPGGEVDASAGLAWAASEPTARVGVTPMFQLIASERARDGGPAADPDNSGYSRLLIAPGVEFKAAAWKFYADIELPLYQRVNGDQLVSPALFKIILSRNF